MDLSDKIKSVGSSDNKKTGRFKAFKNDMKSSLSGLPKALRPIGAGPAVGVNAIGGQIGFKKRTEAQKRAGELNRDEKKMGGKVAKKMQMGGSLKTPAADQKGLKKLPTPVRNKMGFKKNGGTMSKKK